MEETTAILISQYRWSPPKKCFQELCGLDFLRLVGSEGRERRSPEQHGGVGLRGTPMAPGEESWESPTGTVSSVLPVGGAAPWGVRADDGDVGSDGAGDAETARTEDMGTAGAGDMESDGSVDLGSDSWKCGDRTWDRGTGRAGNMGTARTEDMGTAGAGDMGTARARHEPTLCHQHFISCSWLNCREKNQASWFRSENVFLNGNLLEEKKKTTSSPSKCFCCLTRAGLRFGE